MTEPSTTPEKPQSGPSWGEALAFPLCLLGSIVGGAIGAVVFGYCYRYGFYGPPIVGVAAGSLGRLLARRGSVANVVTAGVVGLGATLLAEANYRSFIDDPSFEYFFGHLGQLSLVTWFLMAVSAAAAGFINWPAPQN